MAIKDFFTRNIREEEKIIKSSKDAVVAVSGLEFFLGGAMVLGTISGIFTLPTFLAVTIPALFGVSMLNEVKNNIKDAKERINNLKKLEETGVNASRNHERHLKIEELTEKKNKEIKRNNNFTKLTLGGIAAFALGGFAPVAAAVSLPLMIGGYGTMLYGLYKSTKSSSNGRQYQKQIDKLKDSIAVSNINPRFIATNDDVELHNEKKSEMHNSKVKKHDKRHEAIVDEYIEKLANQPSYEENDSKTK